MICDKQPVIRKWLSGFLVMIVLLFWLLRWPAPAYAQTISLADQETWTQVITYDPQDGPPDIPADYLTDSGRQLYLQSTSRPTPLNPADWQRKFTLTLTTNIAVEIFDAGPQALRAAFAPQAWINRDGFLGIIPLLEVTAEPVYVSFSEPVERQLMLVDLASEDISLLPESQIFSVSSDAAPGAVCDQELQRLGLTVQPTDYDAAGRPTRFTATLVFRGMESKLVVNHYAAQAVYSGLVPAEHQLMTITAIYGELGTMSALALPAADDLLPLWDGQLLRSIPPTGWADSAVVAEAADATDPVPTGDYGFGLEAVGLVVPSRILAIASQNWWLPAGVGLLGLLTGVLLLLRRRISEPLPSAANLEREEPSDA